MIRRTTHMTLLGALLALAPRPLYHHAGHIAALAPLLMVMPHPRLEHEDIPQLLGGGAAQC